MVKIMHLFYYHDSIHTTQLLESPEQKHTAKPKYR